MQLTPRASLFAIECAMHASFIAADHIWIKTGRHAFRTSLPSAFAMRRGTEKGRRLSPSVMSIGHFKAKFSRSHKDPFFFPLSLTRNGEADSATGGCRSSHNTASRTLAHRFRYHIFSSGGHPGAVTAARAKDRVSAPHLIALRNTAQRKNALCAPAVRKKA